MNNERSLNWCLVLYPSEDPKHQSALDYILNNYQEYAFINHDKDLLEDGTTKKLHTHVVIKFKNYRWKNAIAEELGIPCNYLEKCRNLELALKYLIHFNNEEKYQYSINEVYGPLKIKLNNYMLNTDKTENEKVLELLDYIENNDKYIYLSTFIRYCCNSGLYDIYRRSATSFVKLLEEHNYYKKPIEK